MAEKVQGGVTVDIKEIMSILPHSYPFLLVDRVVEMELPHRAVGIKNVTFNEAFFQGHFPKEPVMPGVLIVEAMGQTAGILVFKILGEDIRGKGVYLMALDKVKFRRPVIPGDQLRLELEVMRRRGAIWVLRGKAVVDGNVVAEAEIMAMIRDREIINEGS